MSAERPPSAAVRIAIIVLATGCASGPGAGHADGSSPDAEVFTADTADTADTAHTAHTFPDTFADTLADSADSAEIDAATAADAALDAPLTKPCNGHVELCSHRLDEVAFAGAHNAMSSHQAGFLAPNQEHGLRGQLEDGVRAMLLDTHRFDDVARPEVKTWLCHASCLLGRIPLREGLKVLRDFLQERPREVMILIFEDHIQPAELAAAMSESGLEERVYQGDPTGGWPTLGAMIDSGQQVVVTAENHGPPPPWHHRFWELGWDTPYTFKSMAALQASKGATDSCRLNRGTASGSLFLLNHWLSNALGLPDTAKAATTNGAAVLGKRAQRCRARWQHIPNIVAVDQEQAGDLLAVIDQLNGL